jgi:hypothetical protein
VRLRETLLVLGLAGPLSGCGFFVSGPVHTEMGAVAKKQDALALSDALEELIAAGKDTTKDREFAYETIRAHEESTAAYAFARAAVTGRLVQARGLRGAGLVADMERWAIASRKLDPKFRDGAATRMLGTLYVMAPSGWLEHGDSEQGLELLEAVVKAHPGALENHLRLAEAYIALGDPAPAVPYLCRCQARKIELRRDDQHLLEHLLKDAGQPACAGAPAAAAPAPAAPAPAPAAPPPAPKPKP